MTILEALSTDLKFKRPKFKHWWYNSVHFSSNRNDLLANDWQVLLCEQHHTIEKDYRLLTQDDSRFFNLSCWVCRCDGKPGLLKRITVKCIKENTYDYQT